MRSRVACALALLIAVGSPVPAGAYLKFVVGISGLPIALKWDRMPVAYFVTDRASRTVSASDLQVAVARAFGTWQAVPTATVGASFAGYTSAGPFDDDGRSTIGFTSRPELERVLGATGFVIDTTTGAIVESDIFFNSTFDWSVAPNGEPGRFDLQSIATHEIGHLFGLGHSALGETEIQPGGRRRVLASGAVMFPIAFSSGTIADRALQADDVAGISDLYPAAGFRDASGTLQGRVLSKGRPVFGAHIVAFDPSSGALVGGFTLSEEGRFVISALTPGPKVIRVEPLDDADVDSFFDEGTPIDLNFRSTFFDRLAVVPKKGAAPSFDVTVQPK